jgi:hypothetical protein
MPIWWFVKATLVLIRMKLLRWRLARRRQQG